MVVASIVRGENENCGYVKWSETREQGGRGQRRLNVGRAELSFGF